MKREINRLKFTSSYKPLDQHMKINQQMKSRIYGSTVRSTDQKSVNRSQLDQQINK